MAPITRGLISIAVSRKETTKPSQQVYLWTSTKPEMSQKRAKAQQVQKDRCSLHPAPNSAK